MFTQIKLRSKSASPVLQNTENQPFKVRRGKIKKGLPRVILSVSDPDGTLFEPLCRKAVQYGNKLAT